MINTDEIKFDVPITKEIAERVKQLRFSGYTWRAVSREIANEYPELGVIPGNQFDGIIKT